MEIKIIPFKDREKHCTKFNTCWKNSTDDKIKRHITHIGAINAENFDDLKRLIKIVDNLDTIKLRNNEIAVQFGDLYFIAV